LANPPLILSPTVAAFNNIAGRIPADEANETDMSGAGHRDIENEGYAITLKCHDQNAELYNVVFSRESVRLNSYPDNAIQRQLETWADSVPALA
jgi:hypothetical protein